MILPLNFPFYLSKGPQTKSGKYPKLVSHKLHLHVDYESGNVKPQEITHVNEVCEKQV